MANTITTLTLNADGTLRYGNIPDTLEAMQNEVGGYLESFKMGENLWVMTFCNEEGRLVGLPDNYWFPSICGNILITGIRWECEDGISSPEIGDLDERHFFRVIHYLDKLKNGANI